MNTFFAHINNHTNRPTIVGVPRKKLPGASYTVAGIVKDGALHVGVSKCSPRDQFIKKVGRVRAEGRANSGQAEVYVIPEDVLANNTVGKFFSDTYKQLIKTKYEKKPVKATE